MKKNGFRKNVNIIRKILKVKLYFSFKRCSSRQSTLNRKILKLKRAMFAIKFLKMINRNSIIMNVDEWVFSQSTKSNYSWSKVGVLSNLSKEILKGSISIVSSITSNRVSITAVRNGPSPHFHSQNILDIHFLYEDYNRDNEDKILLIMDNSPVHCSNKVTNYLKERTFSWIFLPKYSPELALVELFFGRLNNLNKKKSSIINLDHKSRRQILSDNCIDR